MTAKIFRNSFFVGLLVLLAAGILFLSVMYGNDETLAFDELRAETAALAPAVAQSVYTRFFNYYREIYFFRCDCLYTYR